MYTIPLAKDQRKEAYNILDIIRTKIKDTANGDYKLMFAYRRKISKELSYDERGKPGIRKMLKADLYEKQYQKCGYCGKSMKKEYSVLDRLNAYGGYIPENVRLIHSKCDKKIQKQRKFA